MSFCYSAVFIGLFWKNFVLVDIPALLDRQKEVHRQALVLFMTPFAAAALCRGLHIDFFGTLLGFVSSLFIAFSRTSALSKFLTNP